MRAGGPCNFVPFGHARLSVYTLQLFPKGSCKKQQYIMGHADFTVTMNVYNHISGLERVKKEVERIERDGLAVSF